MTNTHKYGAIAVYADPLNYLSNRLEKDATHTLRFPSKYEYRVYCSLVSYLKRINQQYFDKPRYTLELQFKITLVAKGLMSGSLTHVVDFYIRDSHRLANQLFVEAKGKFLPEYVNKMKLLAGLKPIVYNRYLVVSDNEPPSSYNSYYCKPKDLESCLRALGIK